MDTRSSPATRPIATLARLAALLNTGESAERTLDGALPLLCELLGASSAWAFLDSDDDAFVPVASHGLVDAVLGWTPCNCQRLLLGGELPASSNVLRCERLAQVDHSPDGLRFHASLALTAGARKGILNLAYSDERPFTDDELDLLAMTGNIINTALDRIEAHQRTTLRLHETSSRLAAALEVTSDAVIFADPLGQVVFLNAAARRAFSPDPGDPPALHDMLRSPSPLFTDDLIGMLTDCPITINETIFTADGRQMPASIVVAAIHEHGVAAGVAVTVRDVTEIRQAEEALRESEERFRSLATTAPIGIFEVDDYGRFLWGNARCSEISGRSSEERHLVPWTDLVHDGDRRPAIEAWERARTRGEPFRSLLRIEREGGIRWIDLRLAPLRGPAPGLLRWAGAVDDVTERTEARVANERLTAVVEASTDLVMMTSPSHELLYANTSAERILEPSNRHTGELVTGEDQKRVGRELRRLRGGDSWRGELELVDRHGTRIPTSAVVLAHGPVGAPPEYFSLVARDESDARRLDRATRFQAHLLDQVPAAVLATDLDGRIAFWNRQAETIFGLPRDEAEGLPFLQLVDSSDATLEWPQPDDDQSWEGDVRAVRRCGGTVPIRLSLSRVDEARSGFSGVAGVAVDDTARVEHERELREMALHDPLTGLPNRTLFLDRLRLALSRRRRGGAMVAVLFLDLDRFKIVNDSLGHAQGDRLLTEVSAVLDKAVRDGDTVARLGGDEFVVCAEGLVDVDEALTIAGRILDALAEPILLGGRDHVVGASIGIVVSNGEYQDPEAMLRDADAAMYRAKGRGGSRVALFDDAVRDRAVLRLDLETSLRQAVADHDFVLHYQPEVDLRTGRMLGVEALLRWRQGDGTMILPDAFITVAEETNLILPLGAWVIGEACRQLAAWEALGMDHLIMNVNLSARQLADPGLISSLDAVMTLHGIRPSQLCLEVTESTVMDDAPAAIAILHQLNERGIRLAVDDFGTGYSSLAYLKRLPVDYLKIDRSFVENVADGAEDAAIVTAIVRLAEVIGAEPIAEGVETEEQRRELVQLGCRMGQGYLWGKAVAADAVLERADLRGE